MATDDPLNTEDQQVEQIIAAVGESVPRFVASLVVEGSERSAVIVGAAQLDDSLERLLLKVLKPQSDKNDRLFGVNGPLRDTYPKINLAYRLGIIDDDVEQALQLVRKIRNDFAHSLESASLSDSPHGDRLNELVNLCEKNEVYRGMRKDLTDLLKREDLAEEVERGQFSESLLDFASVMYVVLYSLISISAISRRVQPGHRAFLDSS
jgi:DNA-binding MltR family transcriptional regulator